MALRFSAIIALFVLVAVPQGQQGGLGQPQRRAINASDDPLLAPFRFRSIGPASMGGRIDDVEAAPSDSGIIYIGSRAAARFEPSRGRDGRASTASCGI